MQTYTTKRIIHIVLPILFSLLMEHLIGMTDTAFLGRVGEIELGASALAGVYYMAIFMLGFGFSIGAQILIGRRNGERQYEKIGDIFTQGLLFLMLLAAVIFALSKKFSPQILEGLIESPQIYEATLKYLDWRIYGFFFAFASAMFRAFFIGTTNTKILTVSSIIMVTSNALLNYILIFGKFGVPPMGIAGAAIGSSASELLSLVFFVLYTWMKIDKKKYGLFRFTGFRPKLLLHMLDTSVWTMIQSFISVSTWFLFFIAVEHLGERALAISNIVRNISSLLFLTVAAFASTAGSLASNLMGAGQPQQVMALSYRIIRICYLFVIPLLLLIALLPAPLLHIYTDNADLIKSTIPSLFVMASAYLLNVPSNILFSTVSGTGNTRSALFIELATLSIYVLYIVVMIFRFKVDVAVAWTTEHIYSVIMLFLVMLYLKKADWQHKKI